MTAQGRVDRLASILHRAGIENADREAVWIAEDARDEKEALAWADRRAAGEPLQYVLGSVSFRHLDLKVGPGAFIPRPETEEVTGRAIDLLPAGGVAVDLCTGAGPIALSIAHERTDARVYATEISGTALEWARRNVGDLQVELLRGHLFDPLPRDLRHNVDVVVSNPPYIAESEREALPRDILEHEPYEALFAQDEGMDVILSIADGSRDWLRSGGWLVLEIGESQERRVRSLLHRLDYVDVAVGKDLAGKDRIAEGRVP